MELSNLRMQPDVLLINNHFDRSNPFPGDEPRTQQICDQAQQRIASLELPDSHKIHPPFHPPGGQDTKIGSDLSRPHSEYLGRIIFVIFWRKPPYEENLLT